MTMMNKRMPFITCPGYSKCSILRMYGATKPYWTLNSYSTTIEHLFLFPNDRGICETVPCLHKVQTKGRGIWDASSVACDKAVSLPCLLSAFMEVKGTWDDEKTMLGNRWLQWMGVCFTWGCKVDLKTHDLKSNEMFIS